MKSLLACMLLPTFDLGLLPRVGELTCVIGGFIVRNAKKQRVIKLCNHLESYFKNDEVI